MRFHEFLKEIHYTDLYPKSFSEFINKYEPLYDRRDLYVNFNDVVGNTINKTFSPTPNHRDPSGLYTYPLHYILDHPADINYGQQARYLRIIQDTSKNTLNLNGLSKEQVLEILARVAAPDFSRTYARLERTGNYRSGNIPAKVMMTVIQMRMTPGQSIVTSNENQRRLFIKAGFDALEDSSRNRQDAVIYEAEPEQKVFLARSAFKVIDVFVLRPERSGVLKSYNPTEKIRRLPAMICQGIDDRIVDLNTSIEAYTKELSYYTEKKRKIIVTVKSKYDFQLNHREHGHASNDRLTVTLLGPDFTPIKHEFDDSATTYRQMADVIIHDFESRTEDRDKDYSIESEYKPQVDHTLTTLSSIAATLKLPFDVPTKFRERFKLYDVIRTFDNPLGMLKNNAAGVNAGLTSIVDRIYGTAKPIYADQLITMWATAQKRKKRPFFNLKTLTYALGIAQATLEPDTTDQRFIQDQYGDVTISQRGTKLFIKVGDREKEFAIVENGRLTHFETMRTYDRLGGQWYTQPEALAAFFTKHRYTVEGYREYLIDHYGIFYDETDKHWKVFKDVAKKEVHEGITFWITSFGLYFESSGTKDWSEIGLTEPEHWHHMAFLFLIQDGAITYINGDFQRQSKGWDTPEDFKNVDFKKINWIKFIQEHDWTFSSKLGSQIEVFGLKGNKDNGKVGQTYRDVIETVGTFNSVEIFSVFPMKEYQSKRYYVDEHMKTLFTTEPDRYDGKHDSRLISVGKDLAPEQVVAVRELITKMGIHVPVKIRSELGIKKKRP